MIPRVRTAILISGRGSNMIALIEAAQSPDFSAEIVLVLSDNPTATGLPLARRLGVAAEAVDFRDYGENWSSRPRSRHGFAPPLAEIVCLAGFMRVLSPTFVERWRGRLLNIHPSLLPNLRGLNTHERALAQGALEHGCTVHLVTAEIDAGPILSQARVPVLPGDDPAALAARVLKEEHRIYPQALDEFARSVQAAAPGGLMSANPWRPARPLIKARRLRLRRAAIGPISRRRMRRVVWRARLR